MKEANLVGCVAADLARTEAFDEMTRLTSDPSSAFHGWIDLSRPFVDAMLPEGQDPDDLLKAQGPDAVRAVVEASGKTPPSDLSFSYVQSKPEALVAAIVGSLQPDALAPIHSNPGPEHVFVDPETLAFTGVIDFGDAYVSHPSFDMRRWSSPEDRAALEEPYREVVALRFFGERSLEEIATMTGRPLGTVKTHLHRGLGRDRKSTRLNSSHRT